MLTQTPPPTYADLVAQIEAEKAARPAFYVGQRVLSEGGKFAGLGTVTKVNRTTVVALMDTGVPVKFSPFLLKAAPADAPTAPEAPAIDYGKFVTGTVVRFTDARAQARFGSGLFVVIKNGGDRINVAKMGGDADRYVRTNAGSLTVVPVSEIAQYLS